MGNKVKLDRANWSIIQYGVGAPGASTPGNIYINSSNGDFYLRQALTGSWQLISGASDLRDWATSTYYRLRQEVVHLNLRFRCSSAHTSAATASGFFTTDLQYWECVSNEGEVVSQAAHGFSTQDVIYYDDGVGWILADASDGAKLSDPPTLVVGSGTNYFLMAQDGTVTLSAHGLTPDEAYFLSDVTPGLLTATEPTASGSYSNPIIKVRDANTLTVLPYRPAEAALAGAGGSGTFLSLLDTPSTYTAYRIPYINSAASAITHDDTFMFVPFTESGRLQIGVSPTTGLTYTTAHAIAVEGTGVDLAPIAILSTFRDNAAAYPEVILHHARGTQTTPTALNLSDYIGSYAFYGNNGTAPAIGASLAAITTEAWTATANGTALQLLANVNGSSAFSSTAGLTINLPNNGDVALLCASAGSIDLNAGGTVLGTFTGAGAVTISTTSSEDLLLSSDSDIINDFTDTFLVRESAVSRISISATASSFTNDDITVDADDVLTLEAGTNLSVTYDTTDVGAADTLTVKRGSSGAAVLLCDGAGLVSWDIPTGQNFEIDFADTASVLDLQDGGLRLGNCTDTTAGNVRWDGTNFHGHDGSSWRTFWDFDTSLNASAGWQDVVFTARVTDSTFSVTDNTYNQEVFRKGRPIRYRQSAGTWRYGVVTNYTAGTVTLAGHPITTSDDDEMQFGDMHRVVVKTFAITSLFADSVDTTLLTNDLSMSYGWRYGDAYVVRFGVICQTEDTGANDPRVNVQVGGNPVSTDNSNAGLEVTSSWAYTTTNTSVTGYDCSFAESIEVSTDANGSNNDAEDLTIQIWFVLR